MDKSMLEKFNAAFDLEGLKEDIEKSSEPKEFVKIPHDHYAVKIDNMEMGLSSEQSKNPNTPVLKVRMKIVEGNFANNCVFYTQSLVSGFGIHNANKFLESLESNQDVVFEDFLQYSDLIDSIYNELSEEGAEYALNYTSENVKGKDWDRYVIEERFKD